MDENKAVTIYEQVVTVPAVVLDDMGDADAKLSESIELWINAISRSPKTEDAYRYVLGKFQTYLQERGMRLDSPDVHTLSTHAEKFVLVSYDRRGRVKAGRLAEGSVNQRLSILSSYYTYVIKKKLLDPVRFNPIGLIDREKKNVHDAADHMDAADAARLLSTIDTSELAGKRDHALLWLALTTGRRANELIKLTWKDITITGSKCLVKWTAKGNKQMQDVLGKNTLKALLAWLKAFYGDLSRISPEKPVFVSLSYNNYGNALSSQGLSDIWQAHGFTTKKHTTRHTFAVNGKNAGLTISELSARLGHSDEKTTRTYLDKQLSAYNRVIDDLEKLYGGE